MSRWWRGLGLVVALVLVLLPVGGLVLLRQVQDRPGDARYESGADFDAGELAHASGGRILTADGQVVEVGEGLDRWVLSEVGVFFTTDEPAEQVGYLPAARLYFTDGTGDPTFTGHAVDPRSLDASPGGRYVSYVETTSGPVSDGQPWTTTVVLDVREHTVVVQESAGLGTWLTGDAVALVSELEGDTRGGAAFLEDGRVLVAGPGFDDVVVDLGSGERTRLAATTSRGLTYPDSSDAPGREHSIRVDEAGRWSVGPGVDLTVPPGAELLGWRSDDLVHGVDGGRLLLCSLEQATCSTTDLVVDEGFSLASRVFADAPEGLANARRPLTLE